MNEQAEGIQRGDSGKVLLLDDTQNLVFFGLITSEVLVCKKSGKRTQFSKHRILPCLENI